MEQQPSHAVHLRLVVTLSASSHDSVSRDEHASLLAPEPHVALQEKGRLCGCVVLVDDLERLG